MADVSSINTEVSDVEESSFSESSNSNEEVHIEEVEVFDDPEVTHLEEDPEPTKAEETPEGIDPETTYYKYDGEAGGIDLIQIIKILTCGTLAAIGNTGVAVTSGIAKAVEGAYDTLLIAGGTIATLFTGTHDLIGMMTGGDTKATESMWNGVKNTVQKEIVNDTVDWYYSDYGKQMNEFAPSILKQGKVGYNVIEIGGEVLGTLAGGELASGSSVLSQAGTNTTVAAAGVKGFGQGTEEAWNNGASTFEGMTYGAGTGTFEAFQWWAGAKINNLQIGKGISKLSRYGNTATRVVLDGVDGAVETPVRSFFDTAYNGKSYGENFNDRGGVQAILQGFLTGTGFSALSEFIQLKMEKSSNISQIDDINYKSKDNYSGEVKNVNDDVIADKGNYKIGPNDIYCENMIENFVKSMDDGNGSGLEALRKISENGGFDFIPDDNIYKQAIQDIPMEKIKTYINSVDARYMNNAICFSSVSDLPDISDRFWTSFDNRGEVRILVNGELLSIDNAISLKMKYDSSLKGKVESFIKRVKENIGLNDKLEQFENAKRFNSDTEIALFFNDKNQYMFEQLKKLHELYPNDPYISYLFDGYSDLPNYMKNADDIYNNIQSLYAIDSSYEPIIKQFNSDSISGLSQMYTKKDYSSIFSDTMKEEGYIYSRVSGPLLVAYERGVDTKFIPSGTDIVSYNPGSSKVQTQYYYDQIRPQLSTNFDKDIYSQVVGVYGDNTNFLKGTKDIDIAIKEIDDMIKLAPELSEDVILYRGTNSLFFNGESISSGKLDISNLKVGQIINDQATVSTSLMFDKCYKSNEIILEILAPKGTKGVYLESMVNGYEQQEFLLGRNTNFRIVSEPVMIDVTYELNGQIIKEKRPKIRVEIVSDEVAK